MDKPRRLSPVLLFTLQHLSTFDGPQPMRVLARPLGIKPTKLAVRVFRLRMRGYADKPGDQAYTITETGRDYLESLHARRSP